MGGCTPRSWAGNTSRTCPHDEVEIARITIASITQDVTSVYARRGRRRIRYRVVDDYDGRDAVREVHAHLRQPLTLGELEAFFNRAWSIYDVLEMNFGRRWL